MKKLIGAGLGIAMLFATAVPTFAIDFHRPLNTTLRRIEVGVENCGSRPITQNITLTANTGGNIGSNITTGSATINLTSTIIVNRTRVVITQ